MPISTSRAPSFMFDRARSSVGSSSCSPLTNTRSASESTLAALGGGSKVCEFVPSGTSPSMTARSPATAATIEVIGATVVTTRSRPSSAAASRPLHALSVRAASARASSPAARRTGPRSMPDILCQSFALAND